MKKIILICVSIIALVTTPSFADKIIINFDDLTTGQILTDQYKDKGIIFSGTGEPNLLAGGVIGTEPDFGTYFFGNSHPNFAVIGLASLTAKFINPKTGKPATVSNFQVRIGDGDDSTEASGVNAFDSNGNLIDSSIIHTIKDGVVVKPNSCNNILFFIDI